MPLYKVTTRETGKKHLVEAQSASSALRHVSAGLFDVETMTNPMDVADLMDQGIKRERAGAHAEQNSDDPTPPGSSDTPEDQGTPPKP